MKNLKSFFRYQLPAIIWAIAIFIQSSIPDLTPPSLGITFQDKIAHAILFGILGFLITRAFDNTTLKKFAVLLSIIVSLLYAISDEFHQSFVIGRESEIGDVIADFVGILIAQFFFYKIKNSSYK